MVRIPEMIRLTTGLALPFTIDITQIKEYFRTFTKKFSDVKIIHVSPNYYYGMQVLVE